MTKISGEVVAKEIVGFKRAKSGTIYYLIVLLTSNDKIGIQLGSKSDMENDITSDRIILGETYTFYLDPTVPESNGIKRGTTRVDFNGEEIYRFSQKTNLYGGIIISLISIAVSVLVWRYKNHVP